MCRCVHIPLTPVSRAKTFTVEPLLKDTPNKGQDPEPKKVTFL